MICISAASALSSLQQVNHPHNPLFPAPLLPFPPPVNNNPTFGGNSHLFGNFGGNLNNLNVPNNNNNKILHPHDLRNIPSSSSLPPSTIFLKNNNNNNNILTPAGGDGSENHEGSLTTVDGSGSVLCVGGVLLPGAASTARQAIYIDMM